MKEIKWVIELKPVGDFDIERRVLKILMYFEKNTHEYECQVSNFDGTGFWQNELTSKANDKLFFDISITDLIKIFREDGQVFEMNLKLHSDTDYYEMIISRGDNVNVLGNNQKLPDDVLGPYTNLDIKLFTPDDAS